MATQELRREESGFLQGRGLTRTTGAGVSSTPDGIDKFFAAVGGIESRNPALPVAISSFELPAGHYDLIARVPVVREK